MTPRASSPHQRPVLIVSPNPDTSDLYAITLKRNGQAVVTAASGPRALDLLATRDVSAVVMDVVNPAADWETCRRLIGDAGDRVPVIVLTGWLDEDARGRALSLGCAAFVAKPASPDRLRDVLERTRAGERGIVLVE